MYRWSDLDANAQALLSAHAVNSGIVVFKRVVKEVGANGAILLSLLLEQARRSTDDDGWFITTAELVQDSTGLTRRTYESGRDALASRGIIQYARRGSPPKTWFRVDLSAANSMLVGAEEGVQIDLYTSYKLTCAERTNQFVQNEQIGPLADESDPSTRRICAERTNVQIDLDGSSNSICAERTNSARAQGRGKIVSSSNEEDSSLDSGPGTGERSAIALEDGAETASAVPVSEGTSTPSPLPPSPSRADLERLEQRIHARALVPEPISITNGWRADDLARMRTLFSTGKDGDRVVAEGGYPARRQGARLFHPSSQDLEALAEIPRTRANDLVEALKAYAEHWREQGEDTEERRYVKALRNWIREGAWEQWVGARVVRAKPTVTVVRGSGGEPSAMDQLDLYSRINKTKGM